MFENSMIADQQRHDDEGEDWLNSLPKCNCCKDPITDEKYIELPNGEALCNSCENDNAWDLWFEWGREQFVVMNGGV